MGAGGISKAHLRCAVAAVLYDSPSGTPALAASASLSALLAGEHAANVAAPTAPTAVTAAPFRKFLRSRSMLSLPSVRESRLPPALPFPATLHTLSRQRNALHPPLRGHLGKRAIGPFRGIVAAARKQAKREHWLGKTNRVSPSSPIRREALISSADAKAPGCSHVGLSANVDADTISHAFSLGGWRGARRELSSPSRNTPGGIFLQRMGSSSRTSPTAPAWPRRRRHRRAPRPSGR